MFRRIAIIVHHFFIIVESQKLNIMNRNPLFSLCLLAILSAFIFVACEKKETDDTNDDPTAANFATADNLYGDVFNVAKKAAAQKGVESGKTETTNDLCGTLSLNPANNSVFPKTLTVDFGDGCTSDDGRFRKGKVFITFSDYFMAPNSTITCTFDEYFVEGHKVEGTYTILNQTVNNTPKFQTTVTDGKITQPTGGVFSWSETRTYTMTAGMGDFNASNDEYDIEGNGSGTNVEGVNFSFTTLAALHVKTTCSWVVSGQLQITSANIIPIIMTIDYGNGTCDNQAIATIGSLSGTITLP